MSLETLRKKVAALPPEQRRHLMGFLISSNMTDEERRELARKLDDKDPSRWLTLEEAMARLANIPEPPDE
ncbi:MAG: hypothetical protein QOE70_6586 [Chthoniobacter sp.]|jgi:hypothetical protein|nr:hypothetical protein [Chthoniobacter sp.]